jgi:hypothetical protein
MWAKRSPNTANGVAHSSLWIYVIRQSLLPKQTAAVTAPGTRRRRSKSGTVKSDGDSERIETC